MNNIYIESKDYKELIVRNEEEDNFSKIEKFESMIEENAILVFTFPNDKSIFEFFDVPKCGKLATPAMSKATETILREYKMARARLINLHDIVNNVFEKVENYPSVKPKLKTDKDKEYFIKALSYFVAKHILIHRCKLGKISNKETKELISEFIDTSNAERGMFKAFHQIANKLKDGGLSPIEALKQLKNQIVKRKEELAKEIVSYNGGYLGNATKMLKETEEVPMLEFNYSNKDNKKLVDVK